MRYNDGRRVTEKSDVVNLEDRVTGLPADVYGQLWKLEKARKQTLS